VHEDFPSVGTDRAWNKFISRKVRGEFKRKERHMERKKKEQKKETFRLEYADGSVVTLRV
jgi:hypothetical protein